MFYAWNFIQLLAMKKLHSPLSKLIKSSKENFTHNFNFYCRNLNVSNSFFYWNIKEKSPKRSSSDVFTNCNLWSNNECRMLKKALPILIFRYHNQGRVFCHFLLGNFLVVRRPYGVSERKVNTELNYLAIFIPFGIILPFSAFHQTTFNHINNSSDTNVRLFWERNVCVGGFWIIHGASFISFFLKGSKTLW